MELKRERKRLESEECKKLIIIVTTKMEIGKK